MSRLKENIIPQAEYNTLPLITDPSLVLDDDSGDLETLRSLLTKHKVPSYVCIRLIHKHFDVNVGEAMVIKDVEIAERGHLSVLRPMHTVATPTLHGIHFFVDNDGQLQPYEYSTSPAPDTSALELFFEEFCSAVLERGLHRKFGLKFFQPNESGSRAWEEFEFPEHRSTMMLPEGWPRPDGDYEVSVQTEFHSNPVDDDEGCRHTKNVCTHQCSHPTNRLTNPGDLFVGGKKLDPDSPFHPVYRAVVQAW